MLSIYATTENIPAVNQTLDSLPWLEDGDVRLLKKPNREKIDLITVDEKGIHTGLDWLNNSPPYLMDGPVPLTQNNLAAVICWKLNLHDQALEFVKPDQPLHKDLVFVKNLRDGRPIPTLDFFALQPRWEDRFTDYRTSHNKAIVAQYGNLELVVEMEDIVAYYHEALEKAPDAIHEVFTCKYFAAFLNDEGELDEAERILAEQVSKALPEYVIHALNFELCGIWMKQLTVPYDEGFLEKLKTTLWHTLSYYQQTRSTAHAGLLLIDAAQIANISNSFTEALGYINQAADIFLEEDLEVLWATAQLRKGTLLYTWAQQGNPTFYRQAIEAFQEALKVFTRDASPATFADIHHQLAVIYSEMPDENKKRSIWAAVSVSSFKEAFEYYNQEEYPYEYAMICNNYGNALTKYPPAKKGDNIEKAIHYYQEALTIRDASYPYERTLTILNYLEACWKANNVSEVMERARLRDMISKAEEVKELVTDQDLLQQAEEHLNQLANLFPAKSR